MEQRITSSHNQRLKDAVRLRQRRRRSQQSQTVIDGAREIQRALDANVRLEAVFVSEGELDPLEASVLDGATQQQVDVLRLSSELFSKVAYGQRTRGLVAVGQPNRLTLQDLELATNGLVCVLEGVEKPGNLGAVLRSADAAAVDAVLVADGVTDLYNPNTIRASLGAVFSLPVVAASTAEALAWMRARQLRMVAARVEAEQSYLEVDYAGATGIILGNESTGLSHGWEQHDVTPVSLPMRGVVDSLNLSVSAAVMFYEALRQRQSVA